MCDFTVTVQMPRHLGAYLIHSFYMFSDPGAVTSLIVSLDKLLGFKVNIKKLLEERCERR